ncbi:hypothetical protein [Acuticoccus sp. I52.16.1]|uniref:hypothetical protein n=1 Tax=Acuticoccus sp. I52.16.1 TaxID=2928472 RepID=UPI001FD5C81C|nr:hypothetical protein [Acuticoccus sp. I52.16.1]UOM37030.1 hypothetical protein MRB58_23355 [Acuticoccus sp. I52.16.1]
MKLTSKLGISAAALAAILTTAAIAQEAGSQAPGRMMQDQNAMPGNMMGGDQSGMQGMMPMMQMMQQMGPMMEQCTEMMAAMTEQMKSAPNGQDDKG